MKIVIVNEDDEIIGFEERATRDPKNISRITNLWITDKEGNILLSQRSLKKDTNPGKWGPAVSGTVEEGETYDSNIIKEAKEEIGLVDFEIKIDRKIRRSTTREYFSQWYTAVINRDYPFVKQDEEVEDVKWFSRRELEDALNDNPEMFLVSVKEHLEYFK